MATFLQHVLVWWLVIHSCLNLLTIATSQTLYNFFGYLLADMSAHSWSGSGQISANMLTDTRLTDVDWHTCTVVSTDTQLRCRLTFDRYVDRVSADSVNQLLILSYGVHKLLKISKTVTSFCPQAGHCGEVQKYLKIPWKSKSFAQSSISYCLFSGRREYQRLIVLNRVWADLQMF